MRPVAVSDEKVPRSFRDCAADLARAQRLIVKVQDEIDWQWRIATPEGDCALAVTMPEAAAAREAMLARIADLFAVRQVLAFTLAVELRNPDAVACFGVSFRELFGCLSQIARRPRPWSLGNFQPIEWLPEAAIDPALIALLPRGRMSISDKALAELDAWFGPSGRYPVLPLEELGF